MGAKIFAGNLHPRTTKSELADDGVAAGVTASTVATASAAPEHEE